MKPAEKREPFSQTFFQLSRVAGQRRSQWLLVFCGILWVILSGLDILIHFTSKDHRQLLIVAMSFVKYLPILYVPYIAARNAAANYLTDIFELEDPGVAEKFISDVAFGIDSETITLDHGAVNAEDEQSPILLIGGPGRVQVNLDHVAVTEKPDGEPRILFSQPDLWELEGFERIREIGTTEKDKPIYAIVSLKDQFIENLSLTARTKDGILIEARDIKVMFSVRQTESSEANGVQTINPEDIHSLVYKQIVMTGDGNSPQPKVGFPWDSTALPLVFREIENLVMQHTLGEILTSIGQKELDQTVKVEDEIKTLKTELTGRQNAASSKVPSVPEFQTRSKITARFYEPEFVEKASSLGVQLIWIDIGTWLLPSALILDKHRTAWDLSKENAKSRARLKRQKDSATRDEVRHLLEKVVLSQFDEASGSKSAFTTSVGISFKRYEKRPEDQAKEILRAFRKELLAAQDMLTTDLDTYLKNKERADAIHAAIEEINYFTEAHVVK